MLRRPIAIVAALILFVEACAIVLVNWVLGRMVDSQHMSMGGIDPDAISTGAWVAGALFGIFLAACGIVLLIIGVRDRAPGRFARIAVIACAVVHGVLGALTVGLVGWPAFAYLMVVLALLVFVLLAYVKERPEPEPKDGGAPDGAPAAA
ncbi:hypothetical protein ACIBCO_03610 [Streptomyces violascens]|uniref:hypothetical protein n=1 Tax=Streptomyces violascens TaxID=67381 RepID=UPI0037B23707